MKRVVHVPVLAWVLVEVEDSGDVHRAASHAKEHVARYGVAGGTLDRDIEIDYARPVHALKRGEQRP